MTHPHTTTPVGGDDEPSSRFTYRHLRLLGKSSTDSPLRVVTLIDFDCFYAQCESVRLGLPPDQPLGVQQFKHVIAINYAARAAGLKKVVTAEEARTKCPTIVLQHVPTWRPPDTTWRYRDDALLHMDTDKASLDYYKLQSRKAMEVLKETLPVPQQTIEREGIDESAVDLSAPVHEILLQRYPELAQENHSLDAQLPLPPTSVLDWEDAALEQSPDDTPPPLDWDDVCLHIGSQLVQSIRAAIFSQLHYTCSAGIARNKVLAKLASGHNKPNRQTVILNHGIPSFLSTYKFTKLRGLGRKLGRQVIEAFNTEQLADLLPISLGTMRTKLGATDGAWVYNVIRGHEHSEVVSRTHLKSVLSAKTFMPPITTISQAEPWLDIFAADIIARLADLGGSQRPRTIAVHAQVNGPRHPGRSKQGPVPPGAKLDAPTLSRLARHLLLSLDRDEGATTSIWPLVTLSVDVSNLEDAATAKTSISSLLAAQGSRSAANVPDATPSSLRPPPPPSAPETRKRTLLDFRGFQNQNGNNNNSNSGAAERTKKARNGVTQPAVAPAPAPAPAASAPVPAEAEAEAADGVYACPTCGDAIAEADVLEHLDWHAAMELYATENGNGGGNG